MVDVKSFGSAFGKAVDLITISNKNNMSFEVMSLGATIRSIKTPDKNGVVTDVVLGYETVEEYLEHDSYFGACIGRYANRIANSEITVNGVKYPLTVNENANQLHGGKVGFDKKIWEFTTTETSVTFKTVSEDMEEGFPGKLDVYVTYSLCDDNKLKLDYKVISDKDTVVNLTNHAYFNLSGHNSGKIDNHYLDMKASFYNPVNPADSIPTGEILSVAGTMFDLRKTTRLGDVIYGEGGSYDHNFVLDFVADGEPVANLYSADSGIFMKTYTNKPGLQIYCAGALKENIGKGGAVYNALHAICLETQFFPNSPNVRHFSSPFVKANEEYSYETVYEFGVK